MTGLDWAESDLRSNWTVGEVDSSATWSHTDSSEPVTEGRNNGAKWVITKVLNQELQHYCHCCAGPPLPPPPPPPYGASGLLVSGVPHSGGLSSLIHRCVFRNRRSVSAFGVRVTTFIVSAEGAVACVLTWPLFCCKCGGAVCRSLLHLVAHPSRDWCACGLAVCVCIDSALPLPGSAAYRLATTGLTPPLATVYVRTWECVSIALWSAVCLTQFWVIGCHIQPLPAKCRREGNRLVQR
jgi:hypothetical protein